MLRPKSLPAIFMALSATLLLTAQASLGEPTDNSCRSRPGVAVPAGMHWYYHLDRADRRHCWYLNSEGRQVHAHGHGTSPSPHRDAHAGYLAVAPNDVASAAQQRPVAQTAETEVASDTEIASTVPAAHQPAVIDFADRSVEVPKSLDLNAASLAPLSNAHAAEQSRLPTLPFAILGDDIHYRKAPRPSCVSHRTYSPLGLALRCFCFVARCLSFSACCVVRPSAEVGAQILLRQRFSHAALIDGATPPPHAR